MGLGGLRALVSGHAGHGVEPGGQRGLLTLGREQLTVADRAGTRVLVRGLRTFPSLHVHALGERVVPTLSRALV